jgi:hypothetical protein
LGGVTEEAADIVIGLWRPEEEDGAPRTPGVEVLEMAVLKARNGETARVRVGFLKRYMTMGEVGGSGAGAVVPLVPRDRAPGREAADPWSLCTPPLRLDHRSKAPATAVRDARGRVVGVYTDAAQAREVVRACNEGAKPGAGVDA